MSTLFIADLHLSENEPAITAGFLNFLRQEYSEAEALYILGDLFEAWIGDDDPNPLHHNVAQALKQFSSTGIPCYFIHGNRDFLLGQRFAAESGLTLLPQEYLIDLYGIKTLLLHGDTLCTDDLGYQRFRRWVHNPLIQKIFLSLPLYMRLRIANRMRANSRQANTTKSELMMDVNPLAVASTLKFYGAHRLIHGHTHRPAIHEMRIEGQETCRVVMGAWHDKGSVLKVTPEGLDLIEFPL